MLQPIADFSKLAVDEADKYIKTGKTGKAEKQLLPCYLITKANRPAMPPPMPPYMPPQQPWQPPPQPPQGGNPPGQWPPGNP